MASEVERLRREVQSLTDKLRAVEVGPTKKPTRRRRRAAASVASATPGTSATVTAVPMLGVGRRRRRRRGTRVGEGEIVIQREELIRSLKLVKGNVSAQDYVDLSPGQFQFLKSISKAFERIQWIACMIYWKPAVGTTFGGLVSYAVDWDSDVSADGLTRAKIQAYTPVCSHAVWQDTQNRPLVLPPSRLMSRTWYLYDHTGADTVDKQPGRLVVGADASAQTTDVILGELWIKYHVKFSGTCPQ